MVTDWRSARSESKGIVPTPRKAAERLPPISCSDHHLFWLNYHQAASEEEIRLKIWSLGAALVLLTGQGIAHGENIPATDFETLRDGKCTPNGLRYITRNCYSEGNCGVSSYPVAFCKELTVRNHVSEVYLRLGMSMDVRGNTQVWPRHKSDWSEGVKAVIENDHLVALDCKPLSVVLQ